MTLNKVQLATVQELDGYLLTLHRNCPGTRWRSPYQEHTVSEQTPTGRRRKYLRAVFRIDRP